MPDNICVAPWGDVVMAEDGNDPRRPDEHLRILLSRMYQFNTSWLPVLSADNDFLGEVTQESIADYLSSGRSRGKTTIVSPAEQVAG